MCVREGYTEARHSAREEGGWGGPRGEGTIAIYSVLFSPEGTAEVPDVRQMSEGGQTFGFATANGMRGVGRGVVFVTCACIPSDGVGRIATERGEMMRIY